ncbi:MAG: hypothetical protein ACOVNY_00410, partial [Chitinophagaceae bacterium]
KKKVPDVSEIQVPISTIRFEKDFFAIDTQKIDAGLQQIFEKYPSFSKDFLFNILGSFQNPESVASSAKSFINSYTSIYTACNKQFSNSSETESAIKNGLQFVKYYFPNYKQPQKIVTFIGPLNSYANIITADNSLAIGLQLYLGKDFSLYQSEALQTLYPSYISRRFEPSYIPVNCMKNVIDDLMLQFKNQPTNGELIEQMVESGKKLYLLDAFLPKLADSLKTGYTQEQLTACLASEKNIWTFFVQNNLLFESDANRINTYVNDAPNTPEFGNNSPGNIGQFVGWKIVQKWMQQDDKRTLQQLIQTSPKSIFEQAKYKP